MTVIKNSQKIARLVVFKLRAQYLSEVRQQIKKIVTRCNNMNPAQATITNVKKIGILRANALGDFIVTLPALHAIKHTYPQAEMVLLGAPWHQDFLRGGRTPVSRVLVVPVMKGIRSEDGKTENATEVQDFIRELKQEQFDVLLGFQGSGIAANPFLKQLGARVTAGVTCREAEKPDRSIEYYYYQSEVIRYLEVAGLIGAIPKQLEPGIKVLQGDYEEAQKLPVFAEKKPYVVLHPIAKDIRRMWPVEHYAPLADHLRKMWLEVVFTGAAEDRPVIDNIISSMRLNAYNACGELSLGGLSAVLQQAQLVIGADTGPLHLARAVDAPTIVFYWAPNLINWGPVTRSKHRPMVSWKMECPICGIVPNNPYPFEPKTTACDHPVSFVSDITVEQVLAEINKMPLPIISKEVKEPCII